MNFMPKAKAGTLVTMAAAALLAVIFAWPVRGHALEMPKIEMPKFDYALMYDDVAMTAQFVELRGDRPIKFQEFREVVSGPQAEQEILFAGAKDSAAYGYFEGEHLFRRDQSVLVEWGKAGKYKASFEFNQIPHRFAQRARTIEQDPEKGLYTVDAGTRARLQSTSAANQPNVVKDLLPTFTERDLEIDRDQYKWNASVWLNENVEVALTSQFENRSGLRKKGTGTYIRSGETFEIRGIELPEPVEYQTLDIGASLTYAVPKSVTNLSWDMSYFHNRVDSLTWNNPFRVTDSLATGSGGGNNRGNFIQGRVALYPDNIANTVTLSQAWTLPCKTRFTGSMSYGAYVQNDSFLPYSTNTAISPLAGFDVTNTSTLPQQDLDGLASVFAQNATLTNTAIEKLKAQAVYRLYGYFNSSDSVAFPGYAAYGDSYWLTNITNDPITNHPPSFLELTLGPKLEYELTKQVSLESEYDFKYKNLTARQVPDTTENTFKNGLTIRPCTPIKLEGSYAFGWRDFGGDYFSHREFSQLRMYDQADRDRHQLQTRLEITPNPQVTVGFAGNWRYDDYKLAYGLKHNADASFSFDGQYTPSEKLNLYTYYSKDHGIFDMISLAKTNSYDTANTWYSNTKEDTHTFGLGTRYEVLPEKLVTDLGWSFSFAEQKIINTNAVTPSNPTSALALAWPDTRSFWQEAKIQVRCKVHRNLELKAYYTFEIYDLNDFAWDLLQPYLQGQLIDNATQYLWLDSRYSDYTAHVFGFSIRYLFEPQPVYAVASASEGWSPLKGVGDFLKNVAKDYLL